jgi:hypothetical protein
VEPVELSFLAEWLIECKSKEQ